MSNYTNEKCKACAEAYEGINGRFCTKLNHYVEYAQAAPCEN